MADSPEVIRQQMEETKSQLSNKLESLEHQVTETVQSTGSAVTATVGAVQDTVETVTGAVQDALNSVGKAFDLQHHIETHPWLVLGGSVVLGYMAADLLEASAKSSPWQNPASRPQSATGHPGYGNGNAAGFAATAAASAHPAGSTNSPWQQLTSAATAALIGIIQDAAAKVVPEVTDYLIRKNLVPQSKDTEFPKPQRWQQPMSNASAGGVESCQVVEGEF